MVTILMMSAKTANPGLRKTKIFWKKGYDVIILFSGVTSKILSLQSNYIVDVVTWPKFRNPSISMKEVIITSSLEGFDKKNWFFWGVVLVQVQQFGADTRYKLEVLHQCGKRVKTKSQKVLGSNLYGCRSYKEKTGRGGFLVPHPILNKVKSNSDYCKSCF